MKKVTNILITFLPELSVNWIDWIFKIKNVLQIELLAELSVLMDLISNNLHLKCPLYVRPISDDADRPFWAEDELSSSESKQKLNKKRKRRSLAYRNRASIDANASLLFHSTSSSTDSARLKILTTSSSYKRKNRQALRRFGTQNREERGAVRRRKCQRNKKHVSLINNVYSKSKKNLEELRRHNYSSSSSNGSPIYHNA